MTWEPTADGRVKSPTGRLYGPDGARAMLREILRQCEKDVDRVILYTHGISNALALGRAIRLADARRSIAIRPRALWGPGAPTGLELHFVREGP